MCWICIVCRCVSVGWRFPVCYRRQLLSFTLKEKRREGGRHWGNRVSFLLCAVHITRSAPIPQPHLSSHELMSWKRVQPSIGLLPSCFISSLYHISTWNTTAGRRYCQGSGTQLGWALMIYSYISAIIPTQGQGVAESRIWWLHWCCLR